MTVITETCVALQILIPDFSTYTTYSLMNSTLPLLVRVLLTSHYYGLVRVTVYRSDLTATLSLYNYTTIHL